MMSDIFGFIIKYSSAFVVLGSVLAFFGWVVRKYVGELVRIKFESALEEIRSKIRKEEEEYKVKLKIDELVSAAIANNAVGVMLKRGDLLQVRRMESAEKIWEAVLEFRKYKILNEFAKRIKLREALEEVGKDNSDSEGIKQMAEVVLQIAGLDNLHPESSVESIRIYTPPYLWALFSVYMRAIVTPAIMLQAIKRGVPAKYIKKETGTAELVKKVLPHQAELIDKNGEEYIVFLIDEIEEKILNEIIRILIGDLDVRQNIVFAKEILDKINQQDK